MATGTRRPSVTSSEQSSVPSHTSYDFPDDAASSDQTGGEQEGILSTTRRKLTLVSLCIVYFAATAKLAILSPFFPGKVSMSFLKLPSYVTAVVAICC